MDTVRTIENCEKGANDKPIESIKIVNCGTLKEGEDDGVIVPDDGDQYPNYVEDFPESPEENYQKFLEISTSIKGIGAAFLKKGLASSNPNDYKTSQQK